MKILRLFFTKTKARQIMCTLMLGVIGEGRKKRNNIVFLRGRKRRSGIVPITVIVFIVG